MSFTQKQVHRVDGIGHDLVELRERIGWTRAEASRVTKIAESTLRAWEEDAWQQFDDPVALERMLRGYLSHLGGKSGFVLQKFRESCRGQVPCAHADPLPTTPALTTRDFMVTPRVLTLALFLGFVGLLGGYVYFQVRTITEPPSLEVFTPADGTQVEQPLLRVTGKTWPEAHVFVNGKKAVVQQDGTFSEELSIPRGITTIYVSAKRRHSEETVVTRRIRFDRESVVTSTQQ